MIGRKIGVRAKIVSYEFGEYLKRATNGEHQSLTLGWICDNGDADNFFSLFANASMNFSRWHDKDFDGLISKARVEFNTNKRIKLYKQAQVIMHKQSPVVFMAHSTIYDVVRKEVSGFVMSPMGSHYFGKIDIIN
ncbi:hypothetical protein [Candidatus Liberibacter americanus]|uniref:hypothetical protein n=1 Tax=Candidatus Liberibacter americanus TaxID=309868 RepID=UPI0002C600FA|nr:dipeptide ABC transporter periplasmic substrate-binding protein DppA [Candidatus Liberibacter americanus PW_SP]